VSTVLRESEVKANRLQSRQAVESRDLAAATLRLLPETASSALREDLREALERRPADPAPTRDVVYQRLIAAYKQRLKLKSTLNQLHVQLGEATRVDSAVGRLLDASRDANAEYVAILAEECSALAQVRPPAALRTDHDRLLQLCEQYRDAVAQSYEAIENERGDDLERSANRLCHVWQARRDSIKNVASIMTGNRELAHISPR
jgi:hypothetical protein